MKHVGVVVFPGFQLLNLAVIAAFELVNTQVGRDLYRVELLSEGGGPVLSSSGVAVETKPFSAESYDTLVVTGSLTITPSSEKLRSFVQSRARASRRTRCHARGQ